MQLTIKKKLLIGFGTILLLTLLVAVNNFIKLNKLSEVENRLLNLRLPTVQAGMELTDGIHLSLAGLRGYMILGDKPTAAEKFKAERAQGWALIDSAVAKMDKFSKNWTDSNNIKTLNSMKASIEFFRIAQQQVEDISHTPENIPSINILLTEAAPKASKILNAITIMINEEATLRSTPARKELLKFMADSRGSFAMGLANIRAFLLSGNSTFANNFHNRWETNEIRFAQINSRKSLLNKKQRQAWNDYSAIRAEFSSLPKKMFDSRNAENWNLANYWLGTKAAPKAAEIMKMLSAMRQSQDKLAAEDQEQLATESQSMKTVIIVGTLIALAIGLFSAFKTSTMIIGPLQAAVSRAKAIGNGNLTGENLISKGNDELTQLTDAINTMKESLLDIVQQISQSSQLISSSSEELSAVTHQTSTNLNEQQSQTEQVATAINQMSATVQEVSSNISSTAEAANMANNETEDGSKMVTDTIEGIQKLATRIENASEVISNVEKHSDNISAVMDVIRGIAEQTNLLALNAAIEAARAGEQGRGFAVVADEVRALAGRTQESAEEINQMIDKLQAGSREAVEVMTASQEEAQKAVNQAAKAGDSLSAISNSVRRINDMSVQIASASEQQNSTTEEINRNISGISQMANETSAGAQQTHGSSEELARLAADLQALARKFTT